MDRDQTSDPASASWHGRHRSAAPAGDENPPPRSCRRRPLLAPASSALAGLLATAALISAACSGNHRPATSAAAGTPIERGTASWYGPKFDGRRTASGERYDMRGLTAAHPTLPFGTLVQVTNLVNGRQVVVRINDRGPFAHRRIIDLSYKAALELEIVGPGTAQVELAIVGHGDLLPALPMPAPPIVVAAVDTPAAPLPDAPSPAYRTVEAAATAAPNAAALGAALDEPRSADAGGGPEPSAAEMAPGMAPAGDGAHFTVQVGAFGEPGRADALRRDLARTYPETAVHSDGLWSRVQIGLFGDREQAETLRRELAATGIAAIVVTAR